ncbi:MAG: exosortase/archaeosortase family protein [Chitinophagaceae bacterium]|nr:exosortase/archaeosortase family protein [Chitinophagaceae bacterium]
MLSSLQSACKTVNRYFDVAFVVKFLLLFAAFYSANMFFVRTVTAGDAYYNAGIDRHFNYIRWITGSIMHSADFITRSLGFDTHVADTKYFIASTGSRLVMAWQCVGLGILSFWLAFILANKMTLRKKIIWIVTGFLVVWVLNCIRTTLLMLALENNVKSWKKTWTIGKGLDHHDIFNYCCYILLLVLIYFFYKKFKPKKVNN